MHIVGVDRSKGTGGEEPAVHTIDVWYSQRRRAWIVERLDVTGQHVGMSHACGSRADALDCLAEWLRAHPESDLGSPVPDEPAVQSVRRLAARRALPANDARRASRSAVHRGSKAATRDLIRRS